MKKLLPLVCVAAVSSLVTIAGIHALAGKLSRV